MDARIQVVGPSPLPSGGVWALGNFDGVHLGHARVLGQAAAIGRRLALPVHVLTFDPHPRALFGGGGEPFLLQSSRARSEALLKAGAQAVATLAFTPDFAALTPAQFIELVLLEALEAQAVVVGHDFVFGSGRGGDVRTLREALLPRGIGVTEVPALLDDEGVVVSSTRIRQFVRDGRMDKAAALLGRSFEIEGVVQSGDQRGRKLGFPTANFDMGAYIRPRFGVYAVRARPVGGEEGWFYGVANCGIRPTIGGSAELLEVHLLDFERDIYGQLWQVAFETFLREELKFTDLVSLQAQMKQDVLVARQALGLR